MRIARFLTAIVLAVGVLIACGIELLMVGCNTAFVKERLGRVVLESTQRSLRIDGDVIMSLTLEPALDIRLGRVTLSERNGTENFAALDSAHMTLRLWPLLSQRLRIDAGPIEIDGLRVQLIRRKGATPNIADSNLPETHSPQHALPDFTIDSLRIVNGELNLRDETDGRILTLDAVQFEGGHLANAAKDHLTLSAKLRKNAAGTRKEQVFDISIAADYDVNLRARRYAAEHLVARLNGPNLGSLRDIAVRLEFTELATDLRMLKIDQMALQAAARNDGDENATQFEGRLTTPLAVDLTAQTAELPGVSAELGASAQWSRLSPLVLTGQVRADFAQRTAAGRIDSHFDGSRLTANFTVARFVPLLLDCDLILDHFDADRFPALSHKGGRHGSSDMAAIADLDVHATLNIGELHLAHAKMRNVHLALRKPVGGGFEIEPPPPFGAR